MEVERAVAESMASLALTLPDAEQIIAAAYDVHVSAMDYPLWAIANPWSKLDFIQSATALISVLHTRGMVVGLSSSPPILEKNDREDAPGERAPGLPPSSPDGETSNETVRIGRLKCYNCGKPKSDPIHKDNFECFFEAISSSTPPSYDS